MINIVDMIHMLRYDNMINMIHKLQEFASDNELYVTNY